jgi:hypothetical protein
VRLLGCLLASAGLASSAGAQSQRSVLVRIDRSVADSSWHTGFHPSFASAAAAGAVLLWPDAPVVQGRPNIGRLLLAVQGTRLTWQPIGAELAVDSTLGVTWGVSVASSGADAPVIGRYIATWQRDASGATTAWRLTALMFTEVPSAAAPSVAGLPLELPPITPAGNTAAFVTADREFARLAGDSGAAVAFERWAAPDAHMFAGGGILVEGPKAIARVVSAPAAWQWHPVAAGASTDGSMGWTVGEAVITAADGHSGPSKYLTVWKRQGDGTIRYFTDGGNGRPAAR